MVVMVVVVFLMVVVVIVATPFKKLIISQLVKIFPAFYGTRKFITVSDYLVSGLCPWSRINEVFLQKLSDHKCSTSSSETFRTDSLPYS
jgi:hypothetical protein